MLASIVLKIRYLFFAGAVMGSFAMFTLVIDEILVIKNGKFTKTTLVRQKKDLKLIIFSGIFLLLSILYELYRAL